MDYKHIYCKHAEITEDSRIVFQGESFYCSQREKKGIFENLPKNVLTKGKFTVGITGRWAQFFKLMMAGN
jgi:hypothetical protein